MAMLNMLVPLPDGGLAHFIRFQEYHSVMKSTTIINMKTECTNFGIYAAEKKKISRYYEGIRRTVFISDYDVIHYDADGNVVEELSPAPPDYPFPPLPQGDIMTRRGKAKPFIAQVLQFDRDSYRPQDGIYFPWCRELEDDDYEVDGGVPMEQETRAVPGGERSARWGEAPGIYIDYCSQGGNPAVVINIMTLVRPGLPPKRLSGRMCVAYSYSMIRSHVFIKKKKSWFKTKTKIKIIRKELHVEGVKCSKF